MGRVDEALARARAEGPSARGTAVEVADAPSLPLLSLETDPAPWASEAGEAPAAPRPLDLADQKAPPRPEPRAGAVAPEIEVFNRGGLGPSASGRPVEKLIIGPGTNAHSIEQYRKAAARLHLAQAERGTRVVMVTSAVAGEGKTLTTANIALTLSESYKRQVLLIDGDLRRPSMHELFGVPNVTGLNDGVISESDRKVPLLRWSNSLTLLTAGRPEPDPMRVLSSPRTRRVIAEAAAKFDWVLIDTPPVGLLTDARLFASLVDTVLLVVEAGRTQHRDIHGAVEALGRERIFGVVLNRTASATAEDYDYYAHSGNAPARV